MDPNHLPVADSAPYHDALAQCVDHWNLVPERTELIRDGVNHVFATETAGGERVVIRVSDGTTHERGELRGELIWLDHLIREGCTVTTPIRSRNGELLETIELDTGTFHVCCFERFGGRLVDPVTDPDWNDELFLKLGREIGRIHRASDDLRLPPETDRKPWYECELERIPDPLPEGFDPRLREPMQAFIDEMRARPTEPRSYGLVHRDVHAGNFLVEAGEVQVIDFDLGCYGWRAMDFSVLLFAHYYLPSHRVPQASPELAGHVLATLVRGYRDEHTIEYDQLEIIEDLIKLRAGLFYNVAAPAREHWQIAMGDPHPTVDESLAWIEAVWLNEADLHVDLGQL